MMRILCLVLIVLSTNCLAQAIPIKVVVVSMFEHGELTGDRPGEFQFWVDFMSL